MAPKQVSRHQHGQQSIVSSITDGLRNPENLSLLIATTVFAGAVTFLQSPWAEYLVPQF